MDKAETLDQQVAGLQRRVAKLEKRLHRSKVWSDDFWERAWAILGHSLAAGGLFYAGLITLAYLLANM